MASTTSRLPTSIRAILSALPPRQALPIQAHRPTRKWKEIEPLRKWGVVKGDIVQVIAGTDRGLQAVVKEVVRAKNSVIVEGAKMRVRYLRPTPNARGKMYKGESLIHVSNVALVDPVSKKPTRISYRFTADGLKVRVAKKSGVVIPKPANLNQRQERPSFTSPLDTAPEDVLLNTYQQELEALKAKKANPTPEEPAPAKTKKSKKNKTVVSE
eukprot:TRINITY_DN1010_c0_g1_i1.p1 TRINITY_DN1010_c0_g1~~TRINITY_DN1010_c0_g1_i1.p1  ORF type:complete len:213 (+),score=70.87 TRINITY_DN1010_c0_g1_i1:84-722(+)